MNRLSLFANIIDIQGLDPNYADYLLLPTHEKHKYLAIIGDRYLEISWLMRNLDNNCSPKYYDEYRQISLCNSNLAAIYDRIFGKLLQGFIMLSGATMPSARVKATFVEAFVGFVLIYRGQIMVEKLINNVLKL
jgi:hypothetical protein